MSYFPCDIPFMSEEELRANGIRIPGTDKNCLTCEFGGRPTYKSPCSECVGGRSQWEEKRSKPCNVCKSLEKGDTLYVSSDWDGGIGFDYIHDIQYCPVCGRKLE